MTISGTTVENVGVFRIALSKCVLVYVFVASYAHGKKAWNLIAEVYYDKMGCASIMGAIAPL